MLPSLDPVKTYSTEVYTASFRLAYHSIVNSHWVYHIWVTSIHMNQFQALETTQCTVHVIVYTNIKKILLWKFPLHNNYYLFLVMNTVSFLNKKHCAYTNRALIPCLLTSKSKHLTSLSKQDVTNALPLIFILEMAPLWHDILWTLLQSYMRYNEYTIT